MGIFGGAIMAFIWSSVKYLIGVLFCLTLFSNPLLGFLVSTLGAMAGIFVFTYGGFWVEEQLKRTFLKGKRKFNKRSRMLIRLKHNGGLPLIALLTPIFLSIPVGCIMATTFIHDRWRIVVFMTFSVLSWGFVIFGTQWLFDLNLAETLRLW